MHAIPAHKNESSIKKQKESFVLLNTLLKEPPGRACPRIKSTNILFFLSRYVDTKKTLRPIIFFTIMMLMYCYLFVCISLVSPSVIFSDCVCVFGELGGVVGLGTIKKRTGLCRAQ